MFTVIEDWPSASPIARRRRSSLDRVGLGQVELSVSALISSRITMVPSVYQRGARMKSSVCPHPSVSCASLRRSFASRTARRDVRRAGASVSRAALAATMMGGRRDRDNCGTLMLLGLFTRPAAFVLSGQMAVANFAALAERSLADPQRRRARSAVLFSSGSSSPSPARGRSASTACAAATRQREKKKPRFFFVRSRPCFLPTVLTNDHNRARA
jgi:hypothetical protein